jgi:hypothetical protein
MGACEALLGCESTSDCPSGTFCDTATGSCVDDANCTRDVQCPLNQICDTVTFRCVNGCYESGDCQLGHVCHCGDGTSPAPDGGASCSLGQCVSGYCDNETDCDYGDLCEPVDEDGGLSECVLDTRGPYCQGCSYEPGQVTHCGTDPENFCLLDRKVSYYMTYCGVDCAEGQQCPFGYDCQKVLILTHAFCHQDSDCPVNGPPCQSDADCLGSRCDLTAMKCAGKCSFNEDSLQGYCTCTQDSDCPQDACDVTSRTCTLTGIPCTLGGNECAGAIYCSKSATQAACYIGANCKPSLGLTCVQVLAGTPTP